MNKELVKFTIKRNSLLVNLDNIDWYTKDVCIIKFNKINDISAFGVFVSLKRYIIKK